jgi:hypothetical protein
VFIKTAAYRSWLLADVLAEVMVDLVVACVVMS